MNNLIAVNEVNEKTNVLGFLCWYSVGEDLYDREDMREKLINSGLNESYLPNNIRPADAFKRATKGIEQRNIKVEEGVYENYLVRDVLTNRKKSQRNLVKEVKDTKGQCLIYEPAVAELVFDREHDSFIVNKRPNDGGIAEDLIEEAERLFDLYLKNHNANVVRTSISTILKGMSPTPVRPSGGVYFVLAKYEGKLTSMVSFLNSLKRGEGFKIPLIDSSENRDMIKDKLSEHLEKTLMNCHEILKRPKVQKVQVRTMIDDARQIIKDFNEYRELITGSIDDMENNLDLIKQQIQLLFEKETTPQNN